MGRPLRMENFCPGSGLLFPIHLEASILFGPEGQGGACRVQRRWDSGRQTPPPPHPLDQALGNAALGANLASTGWP